MLSERTIPRFAVRNPELKIIGPHNTMHYTRSTRKQNNANRSPQSLTDSSVKKDLIVPGRIVIPGVRASIKCDKGERTRFWSDVLSFNQMSEQLNKELSLTGKIPSGHFNTMFNFRGSWQKDASSTKSLAFDGWFITLYSV